MPSLSKYETEEALASVADMAKALMSVREVAVLMDMSVREAEDFVYAVKNDFDIPIVKSYKKGRLATKLELRKKVVSFAIKGSPAAQPLADDYLKENEYL